MKQFKLRKGLKLPIKGSPRPEIGPSPTVTSVAILGDDYLSLKPTILVAEGDTVVCGTPLMIDKNVPEAQIVAPVAGKVRAINRGARRKLISIVIDVDEAGGDPVDFSSVGDAAKPEGLVERLCAACLLYTSPSPRDLSTSRMPSSA